MNLYELTEQYDEVMSLLYDNETDEQTILDTLESIDGEIEDKADNYASSSLGKASAERQAPDITSTIRSITHGTIR